MKQNRSVGRGIKLSKERIEKDLVKLKRRMNQLYVEVMARERALELFATRTDERTLEEATNEIESQSTEKSGLMLADIKKVVEQSQPITDIELPVVFPNALGITEEDFKKEAK